MGINPNYSTEAEHKIIFNGQRALTIELMSAKPPSAQHAFIHPPTTLDPLKNRDRGNMETLDIGTDPSI